MAVELSQDLLVPQQLLLRLLQRWFVLGHHFLWFDQLTAWL